MRATELHNLLSKAQSKILILDARYVDEYGAGHIKEAVNIRTYEAFIDLFQKYDGSADYVIVHCEFSALRGPILVDLILGYDQIKNPGNFLFPEVYLLENGYSTFYSLYPQDCEGDYLTETNAKQGQDQYQARLDMEQKIKKIIAQGEKMNHGSFL
jgi:M-phase inducer tyrosine phosphatase